MKKTLYSMCAAFCLTAALTVPASALQYTVGAPDDYLFGRPTSDDTIYVTTDEPANTDRSKSAARIPPAFGSPTSYTLNAGELLTPNLVNQNSTTGTVAGGGVTVMPPNFSPNTGGSSIGVRRAENERELSEAAAYALRFGKTAVIEPCLTGFTEINCAAYRGEKGIRVSECERPVGRGEVLSFKDKYQTGTREFPANIPSELSDKIKSITEKVYEKMGFSGIVRADYFISGEKVYLNEINAVPGSLAYYLFTDTLAGFKDILTELIGVCVKDFSESGTLQRNYDSGILRAIGGKSAKRL